MNKFMLDLKNGELDANYKSIKEVTTAPPGILMEDFNRMMGKFSFAMREDIVPLLLIQSILGHAQNGHTKPYNQQAYPGTTIEDICVACKFEPIEVAQKRQDLINYFEEWLFNDVTHQTPIDSRNLPLFGIDYFDPKFGEPSMMDMNDIRKGFILGAYMDSWEVRQQVNEIYEMDIGGGQYHYIDLDMLAAYGSLPLDLAHKEHDDEEIEKLKKDEIIVNSPKKAKNVIPTYIRHKIGKGVSDDAAIVLAIRKYNSDVGMGVLLADAVDTWDKYCSNPVLEGHDERIAAKVLENFPEMLSQEDLFIFVKEGCSIPKKYDPDSSQRYFLQIDLKTQQAALEGHFDFANGKPYEQMMIGFNHIENKKFYGFLSEKFNS